MLLLGFVGCAHAAATRTEAVEPVAVASGLAQQTQPTTEISVAPAEQHDEAVDRTVVMEDRVASAARRLELAREELDRQYNEALQRATQTGRHTKLSRTEAQTLARLFLERARQLLLLAPASDAATALAGELQAASALTPSRSAVAVSRRLLQRAERLVTAQVQ